MIFKKGELFCGPGGLALGAKQAHIVSQGEEYKIEHVWANDIDRSACETYIKNICKNKPESVKCGDVRKLNIKELEEIDALTFGFPCNDFSIVGEQKGFNGKYGPLYTYGVEVLNYHNPKWFLAENVGGLRSADDGKAFEIILDDLSGAGKYGYEITAHLYKFEEYGVPQTRHRIIIVGIRKDLNLKFRVPAPITLNRYKTAKEALEDPPIPPNAPNNEKTRHPKHIVERLKYIPPGENAWYEGIPEYFRLNVKGAKLSNIYRRLHPDKPAYTVTGSGGGGTHMYHYSEPRALTNRERARLQDFPDDFVFYGTKEEVRKQIGMAVPPTAAKIIFEAVLKTFAGIKYDSVEAKWDAEIQL
ncbi:MAG: (cytosine-5)-methyltransferase 1 [Thermosediminibacterales bacterium]|nr:(cytosine-5)-methyltransferase 1 [Thermosediminibacterales bacterium]